MSTASFVTRLEDRARAAGSLLCVGLDPHPADLPASNATAARDFCLRLMNATAETAAAFKPNSAFFEAFGAEGLSALQQVIAAAPDGIPVILDAKRGDIASTAEAYARACFDTLGADAVTANPYLGQDSLEPFWRNPQHGVFLLCKTSNPGAADLQDLRLAWPSLGRLNIEDQGGDLAVYEVVAHLAQTWNQNDNLGLVVGATQPGSLARVRKLAPDQWILAPGVGAQGGDLKEALRLGLRTDGMGLLVPVSRSVSRASDPRRAAVELRDEIRRGQEKAVGGLVGAKQSPDDRRYGQPVAARPVGKTGSDRKIHATQAHASLNVLEAVADGLLEAGCVRFGQFTLKSGLISPIYLDLRLLVSRPQLLAQVASAYLPVLDSLVFDRLAALPYAALPIGTAISLQGGWPLIYPRKETKAYGTQAGVEGVYQAGERVVVIDDLATTGGSKFEAIEKLASAGLVVKDVVVLIDRQSGARQALAQAGYTLHAVFDLSGLLSVWEQAGRITAGQADEVRWFLANTQA